jgi:phytoene/squalene synthetase
MKLDLDKSDYNENLIKKYIYGSAEVVGLMCLKVFVNGNQDQYEKLKPFAQSLGAAFQKVNFLRDIGHDTNELGRTYFPEIDMSNLSENDLNYVFNNINNDFSHALTGIKQLPDSCRFGVYVAYIYYYTLFEKLIKNKNTLLKKRVRINNAKKFYLIAYAWIKLKSISNE